MEIVKLDILDDFDNPNKTNFRKAIEFVHDILANNDIKQLNKFEDFTFYGEAMIKNNLAYDFENIPAFIGFDIRAPNGEFIEYPRCKDIFNDFGFTFVPVEFFGTVGELRIKYPKGFNDDNLVPKSLFGEVQEEGFVIKNYTQKTFGKYKTAKFKESHGKKKTRTNETNEIDIVDKYCTSQRIKKTIQKLIIEDGEYLDLKLMKLVPKLVTYDMWSENWEEIVSNNNYSISFKALRSEIAKRCLLIIKDLMNEKFNE